MLYQDLILKIYEKKEEKKRKERRNRFSLLTLKAGSIFYFSLHTNDGYMVNQSTKHGIVQKDTKSAARMPA